MINLINKVSLQIRKYKIIFLLAVVALAIFLVKFFWTSKIAPSAPVERLPIPAFNQTNITNRIVGYQFNFSLPPNFPKELPVYKISDLKTEAFPEIKPDYSGNTIITEDTTAVRAAKAFLQEKGVTEESLGLSQLQYRKIDKTEAFAATSSAEADIFIVNFWPQINSIAVVSDSPQSPLTSVWIGKNGKTEKAFSTTLSYRETGSFSLRSLQTASDDLVSQKGALVWLDEGEDYGYIPPKTVLGVVLQKVSLAYYLPSNNQDLLQPIFVFEGTAQIQGEQAVRAAVYLPALDEKYFTNPAP